jgi:hypothetical protein
MLGLEGELKIDPSRIAFGFPTPKVIESNNDKINKIIDVILW